MNVLVVLLISLPLFGLAYFFYANYIGRALKLDAYRPTPAVLYRDDRDFVPTQPAVIFAHHFAAIAGAGPIVGPTVALLFGYVPVWLWILVGAVFIGAVHDFTALFVSVREGGKSMAEVAGRTLGRSGFILFISFTIIMIVLVTAAFLGLTTKALTSLAPLATLQLPADQTLLHTVVDNGVIKGKIGGIASTSVIIMTLFAPLLGYFLYVRKTSVWWLTGAATVVAVLSIYLGFLLPITFDPRVWMVLITIYTFIAAWIPVWVILQPRDFINVQILYAGIAALLLGIVVAGLKGVTLNAPAFNLAAASAHPALGSVWPVLFITVACGAISGFHALVSGGTSGKQVKSERDILPVAYGAMLLEAVLAVCVVIVVGAGLRFPEYISLVFPAQLDQSNPVLAFSLATGNLLNLSLGIPQVFGTIFGILMLEGFVVTTLDVSVRLNRYLFEELWGAVFKKPPRILKSYLFNSFLSVTLMLGLASTNAYITIWPIFGTGNQLLAALTLISISAWLIVRGRPAWFTIIPALFMLATTFASLLLLLFTKYIPGGNYPLLVTDLLLLALSFGVAAKAAQLFIKVRKGIAFNPEIQLGTEQLAEEMHLG
ncbi:MAG: carbon starvation CstA family protein [Candidatus Margulisiibacteriota bacterium]